MRKFVSSIFSAICPKVDKKYLLIIAGIVWFIAGFNIVRIGLQAGNNHWTAIMICIAAGIFLLFHNLVFRKMVKKHTTRIQNLENIKHNVFKFFDKKAYFIMAFMITFGVGLRMSNLCPDFFIAVFYLGLGFSLIIAGLSFVLNFFRCKPMKNDQYLSEIISSTEKLNS